LVFLESAASRDAVLFYFLQRGIGIEDSFKKIVIAGERMKLRKDDNGIMLMGVYEFLKNAILLDA